MSIGRDLEVAVSSLCTVQWQVLVQQSEMCIGRESGSRCCTARRSSSPFHCASWVDVLQHCVADNCVGYCKSIAVESVWGIGTFKCRDTVSTPVLGAPPMLAARATEP